MKSETKLAIGFGAVAIAIIAAMLIMALVHILHGEFNANIWNY